MMFDLNALKSASSISNRFERRLKILENKNQDTDRIRSVVNGAIDNIKNDRKSFVIYGEPQSGKTEMMIALTARLLDEGHQIIVGLLNDSVQLLGQNLDRFQRSGLAPSPKKFSEILSPEVKIGTQQWVIFCKKNSKDLQKLNQKLDGCRDIVIIDDEADYATPNSKINLKEKSKINQLTSELIGESGVYIGVTATPARLDLNNTHQNQNECWIDFKPHSEYTGQDIFFPIDLTNLPYRLTFLSEAAEASDALTASLLSFIVNVAYLNTLSVNVEENYSLLVHTSGKKSDHSTEYKLVNKIFGDLLDSGSDNHEAYYKALWDVAIVRYPDAVKEIVGYVYANCNRYNIVVMNSDKEVNAADNKTATDPTSPFTIVIGGNIVSRGVTFNNLLSMFFTRDVKKKLQQDTYIQRARMFGSRNKYLKYFELNIPKGLFLDWQKCFIFHRLSLESRKQVNRSPVWLDGERVTAVSGSSVDKSTVVIDKGEMSFGIFDLDEKSVSEIIKSSVPPLEKIKALSNLLGEENLPTYLFSFIKSFCPKGDASIAIHLPKTIKGYKDKVGEVDKKNITRRKGFIGNREMQLDKFPDAVHHLNVLFNESNRARVFYKYNGNIRFLKTSG